MSRGQDRAVPESAAGPNGVQDLVAALIRDDATKSIVTFQEDGTADETVYGGPGSLSFHPKVAVANPTRHPRRVTHLLKPGQS